MTAMVGSAAIIRVVLTGEVIFKRKCYVLFNLKTSTETGFLYHCMCEESQVDWRGKINEGKWEEYNYRLEKVVVEV